MTVLLLAVTASTVGLAYGEGGWIDGSKLVRATFDRRNPVYEVGETAEFTLPASMQCDFQVRNYYGRLVAQGHTVVGHGSSRVVVPPLPPGWYKLYLRQGGGWLGESPWVVFRTRPGFPPVPHHPVSGGDESDDEVMRGVIGMGPQRHKVVDAAHPGTDVAKLEQTLALDRQYYRYQDPYRSRALLIAFPNGTQALEGVRRVVERFKHDVEYWEPRNEPNFGSGGAAFAINEQKQFYETVKAVDPRLKVLGPGIVSINPRMLAWLDDFFSAGGGRWIDAFSFHAYNDLDGDVFLGRRALDALTATLSRHGYGQMEKWQTEQGYPAALYGVYQPRLQGRWTMLQMLLYEQYGIPKEHNHLWYDRSHGFWDQPEFWENDDGSLNPAAVLMRVWSEELYGKRFVGRIDGGEAGNNLFLGDVFQGPQGRVMALITTGETAEAVQLSVRGNPVLHVCDAFGLTGQVRAQDGTIQLPISELPTYVDITPDQEIAVVPTHWGPNLARLPGTLVTCPEVDPAIYRQVSLGTLINGEFENWYWSQRWQDAPWNLQNPTFPVTIDVHLPEPQTIDRVVLYAMPPWQAQGTLIAYDLQVQTETGWRTVAVVREPTNTVLAKTAVTRTALDSYFSDRSVFQNNFKPVRTGLVRLVIRSATHGGAVDAQMAACGGQGWGPEVVLREIEIYGR